MPRQTFVNGESSYLMRVRTLQQLGECGNIRFCEKLTRRASHYLYLSQPGAWSNYNWPIRCIHHREEFASDVKWPITSAPDEPVLDEAMFQQLLAACYALQEHARQRLEKEAGTIAERAGPIQSLQEPIETDANSVALMEPVLPVARALSEQADRLRSNGFTINHYQTLPDGSITGKVGPIQVLPDTREHLDYPVSPMESSPVAQSGDESSEPRNRPRIRPAVVALIEEINGLLKAKERTD